MKKVLKIVWTIFGTQETSMLGIFLPRCNKLYIFMIFFNKLNFVVVVISRFQTIKNNFFTSSNKHTSSLQYDCNLSCKVMCRNPSMRTFSPVGERPHRVNSTVINHLNIPPTHYCSIDRENFGGPFPVYCTYLLGSSPNDAGYV